MVPESGLYAVYAQLCITSDGNDFYSGRFYKNDSLTTVSSYSCSFSTNTFTVSVDDIINATAGDRLEFRVYIYNPGSLARAVFSGPEYTYMTIYKIT